MSILGTKLFQIASLCIYLQVSLFVQQFFLLLLSYHNIGSRKQNTLEKTL